MAEVQDRVVSCVRMVGSSIMEDAEIDIADFLAEDLGYDSLDRALLIESLEVEFDVIELDDFLLMETKTVKDVIDVVEKALR